jgi:AcrR family transcriptional regulator
MATESTSQRRLPPDARRSQLLSVASEMVIAQGGLPLSIAEIGRKAGVSKALFYAYFPSQHDLLNAILLEQLEKLEAAGLSEAARKRDFFQAVASCAAIYFDHVAERGPLLHIVLRDAYMAGHVSAKVNAFRDRIFGALARAGRRKLGLNAKEAIAVASLVVTIPEEAGRLVFDNEMKRDRARELCLDLVASALKAIAPAN